MQMSFFPSRTLSIYVGRMFLTRSLAVLAMLLIVLQTLDLLGESGRVLAYPGNGEAQLWHYVSLRAPQIVALFLPFSVLLGTIITLSQLNANSEVISMKSGGLSAHQILAPLFLVAAGIAVVSFVFNERVVTRATAALSAWEDVDYGKVPVDSGVRTNVWVRDGDDLIHADTVQGAGRGTALGNVQIFDRRGNYLVSIIQGPRARYTGDRWVLEGATRFDVASGTARALGDWGFGEAVRPQQFNLAKVDAEALSFGELRDAIENLRRAGRPVTALESELWHKLARPFSALLMPLLGSVAAFGLARSGRLFVRSVIGMALGFAYFAADNFALAMGNLGVYPPSLAAWAPFLLFFIVGETVLIRTEE
jgi:lipopolysaccharide export system permease protein